MLFKADPRAGKVQENGRKSAVKGQEKRGKRSIKGGIQELTNRIMRSP